MTWPPRPADHAALLGREPAPAVIARNLRVYRYSWLVIVSGFFEPLFYLLSLGVGLGRSSATSTADVR